MRCSCSSSNELKLLSAVWLLNKDKKLLITWSAMFELSFTLTKISSVDRNRGCSGPITFNSSSGVCVKNGAVHVLKDTSQLSLLNLTERTIFDVRILNRCYSWLQFSLAGSFVFIVIKKWEMTLGGEVLLGLKYWAIMFSSQL